MYRIYKFDKTFTVVGGSYSFNTPEIRGEVRVIQIKPTTSTTRFTVTITNSNGIVVYKESNTGNLLDERIRNWYGIYTISISASTVNESYTLELDYVDMQ
jgi:hypothetical protein